MFAANFGLGVSYELSSDWFLRSEFREFVAFPGDDSDGFAVNGQADPLWIERATFGVGVRF